MKFIIVAALLAVATALPVEEKVDVDITKNSFEQLPDGGYSYRFELSNKQTQEETGEVREVPNEDNVPQKVVVVRGSYSYINPEGKTETITYYADESGFHPEGPSIPVVPEN